MKATASNPDIPVCHIQNRLVSSYDFFPRLQKLCSGLGFNNARMERTAGRFASGGTSENNTSGKFFSDLSQDDEASDRIIILSTTVPYEQSWGGYDGLPGLYYSQQTARSTDETPSDFIRPYLQQYQFAQEHIFWGYDEAGECVVQVPESLLGKREDILGNLLQVNIAQIAASNSEGLFTPLSTSGHLVTFPLASGLSDAMAAVRDSRQRGRLQPIGSHLRPDLFQFSHTRNDANQGNAFAATLFPMLPWIVTHKTPHLAAALVILQLKFAKIRDMLAATGTDDTRNILCVVGLDIDMRGFRGRPEGYFVPWQACWKRNGHCYDNIYPLDKDDLLVALKNFG